MLNKQLLFIISFFSIGYISGDYQDYYFKQKAVAEELGKARYFFIGFNIKTDKILLDGNLGWIANDGYIPDKKELYKFLQKDKDVKFKYNDLVIVGLYEFKTKVECEEFFKKQNSNP